MSIQHTVVNVLYPRAAEATFNMDFYLNIYMPLIQTILAPLGLRSWSVATLGEESDYYVQSFLIFATLLALEDLPALEILNDIVNFTSVLPIRWAGTLMGHTTIGTIS